MTFEVKPEKSSEAFFFCRSIFFTELRIVKKLNKKIESPVNLV